MVSFGHDRGLTPDMARRAMTDLVRCGDKSLQTAPVCGRFGPVRGLTPDMAQGAMAGPGLALAEGVR